MAGLAVYAHFQAVQQEAMQKGLSVQITYI